MMWMRLRRLAARVRAFFVAGRDDRDFDEELASHLAMMTEENMGRGMTPEAARRAASIRMGSAASLREQHRDVRGLPMIETIVQDLRFAIRMMTKDRWFAAAAIVVLALGIGANTVGFTVVNGAFLRGLPFDDADRLLTVSWQPRTGRRLNTSYAELQDWRNSKTFEQLAAYADAEMSISDDVTVPEQVRGTSVTANTFSTLRQPPFIGRDFVEGDERPGADPVAIIGYGIWQRRYARDPAVVGKTLRVNGRPVTIVGVMPEGMQFPETSDLWVPFVPTESQRVRTSRGARVFGRLAAGVDRREAEAEFSGIARQLQAAYPKAMEDIVGTRIETFTERYIGGGGRPMLITVMVATAFVLLIACANVANLLLSRSTSRAREIAARMALGATRWRIVRQLLVESAVLGVAGGGLGLFIASAGTGMLDAAVRGSVPYWVVFRLDYSVFAYVAAICLLTAAAFGLGPALQVSKANSAEVLKEGGRGSVGSRRNRRFGTVMVVTELALTIILLVGAGTMIRSFVTLYFVDLGLDVERLMAMRVQLPATRYPTAETRRAFFDQLQSKIEAVAGIEAATMTTGVPPLDGGERLLEVEGQQPADRPPFVGTVTVSPRFFDALGVRLVRGRAFEEHDGSPGSETVIINDRLAGQFFPGEDPVGRRLRFTQRQPVPGKPTDVWRTIVGVSPLIKQGSPSDRYVNAVVYIPLRQETPSSASLLVRSTLPTASVMDAVRREVQRIDPDQPVFTIQTVTQVLAADRWWQRTWGMTFGLLAAIGLLLSSVGLYAVMASAVAARTQEIGVRLALGAQRRQVWWLVLRRGLVQVAIGTTIGLAGSLILRRLLPGGIEGISSHDPVAIGAILVILSAVCLAACVQPARRATRVDPVIALRAE
jgi:putative ABC transport system permease protein